jgi:glycosyltransferase involved in cell wall biosynthesis
MFKITIPCYNCQDLIVPCLESIIKQTYTDWEAVVVNDGSTDKTDESLKLINDPRIKVITNEKNIGSPLASIVAATNALNTNPDDVIINIDADDQLYSSDAFEYLVGVYSDPNILMTYGQFEPMSHTYHNYCKPIPNTETYRKSGYWYASHLRTYKKKLFDLINDNDLRDDDGEYFKMAGDAALLYPLIELAGNGRVRFIDKILYLYNDLSELNEMKVNSSKQVNIANKVRSKPEYKRANI